MNEESVNKTHDYYKHNVSKVVGFVENIEQAKCLMFCK